MVIDDLFKITRSVVSNSKIFIIVKKFTIKNKYCDDFA